MGRTAYDFDRYASKDLRRYLKHFVLPEPAPCPPNEMLLTLPKPPKPLIQNDDRNLAGRNEGWRRLECIELICLYNDLLLAYLSGCIGQGFKLSRHIHQKDPIYSLPAVLSDKFYTHKPCDVKEMTTWLMLPLVTATRVMHNIFSTTTNHVFDSSEGDLNDGSGFKYLLWTPRFHKRNVRDTPPPSRVVVAYQTPFTLTERDLSNFINCTSLPPSDRPYVTMPNQEKLWVKIWDTCYTNHCRWFVLTTYTHWVFGHFSDSMRTASVTPIYRSSNASPTILEILVYWLASAMGGLGAYKPLEPIEPVPMDVAPSPVDSDAIQEVLASSSLLVTNGKSRLKKSIGSEIFGDAWPRKDEEEFKDPNIDLQSVFDKEGSQISYFPVQDKLAPQLQSWVAASKNAVYHRLDEDDFVLANEAQFDMPAEDRFDPRHGRGEWMV